VLPDPSDDEPARVGRHDPGGSSDAPAAPAPFSRGSVSLRLYPHNELAAPEVVGELCAQGALGGASGFDGVMTSEHHGGFPGYLPNPLQAAGFILAEGPAGWVAACPLLLPLRPTALVAEEVAWLAARHPGRVGVGVAAGALPLDFEVMGVAVDSAVAVFRTELPRLVDLLSGRGLGPLAGDPALRAGADHPVPVLSAAVSPAAARRAARSGAGILMEGMSPPEGLARITSAYDQAGGTGAKVLIRRVWLGDLRTDLVEAQRQVYDTYAGDRVGTGGDNTLASDDPVALAGLLDEALQASGADALNVRVHLPGMSPPAIRDQITRLGAEVLPLLRARSHAPWS
jgi:alkanesulfonate monooxygenase SsuD/methylene tetrahydromethanopterin reductase-like flavin-dependent oxidoreductase (luciferase family)